MFFNKKGVSEVVANVLIVLLVIVGVAVIWSVVKPTIDKSADQIDTGCFEVSLEAASCKMNLTGANGGGWNLSLKRSTGSGKLTGMKFIFEDASGATQVVDAPASGAVATGIGGGVQPAITSLTELATLNYYHVRAGPATFAPVKVNVAAVVGDNARLCQPLASPVVCN